VTLTRARVTTMLGFRTPVSTGPQGQYQYHQFYRHPERQAQWVSWLWDAIQSFKPHGSTGPAILTGDFLSLELRHISICFQLVGTTPIRNWKNATVSVIDSFFF
jgi:hypothetical protein